MTFKSTQLTFLLASIQCGEWPQNETFSVQEKVICMKKD